MLPLEHPDRIHVAFDDHRLVANAGLLLPVTLAHHLGLNPNPPKGLALALTQGLMGRGRRTGQARFQ